MSCNLNPVSNRAITEPLQSHYRAITEPLQSHYRAITEHKNELNVVTHPSFDGKRATSYKADKGATLW